MLDTLAHTVSSGEPAKKVATVALVGGTVDGVE
jgi:hypothetical protein